MLSLLSSLLHFGVQYGGYYTYSYGSGDSAAAVVPLLVTCCCVVLGLAIDGVISYLVYKDAVKNNVENPILWAVLTFFFTLIGLLVYFLAIRPKTTTAPVIEKKPEDKK